MIYFVNYKLNFNIKRSGKSNLKKIKDNIMQWKKCPKQSKKKKIFINFLFILIKIKIKLNKMKLK